MSFSPLIVQLMEALQCLPGVGPKTAQRIMLHLLERGRDDARQLATALAQAADSVGHFQRCRTLTENDICSICSSHDRDSQSVCVVETPADIFATEQAGATSSFVPWMVHLPTVLPHRVRTKSFVPLIVHLCTF